MSEETKQHMQTSDQKIVTFPITQRVKIYQLNEETQWDDKGTGPLVYVLVN